MKSKTDAIFELRDAAEAHGRLAVALDEHPESVVMQNALLDARSALEAATSDAIDSCHHCGLPHPTQEHA